MDIAITRMSSKGQIVIPVELRKGLSKGEKLLILRNKKQLIIQRVSGTRANFDEDLEFARRTEEAWKRIERGEGIKMDFDAFMEQMRKH
ncbi:MAG TPA: AbrB/MazE/SpoVT family DNA-binding domain-containing protein [Candidatus Nanoarchaeia archaeon]|nr:AbrB/MazE/SpoVT family DNA-binding domain-containing protein [Candidatus Nanoarchaeia archaeon]